MDLFERFKIITNCVLCGCKVNQFKPVQSNSSQSKPTQTKPKQSFLLESTIPSQAKILCHFCHQRLPLTKHSCFSCGLPLASNVSDSQPLDGQQLICGSCLTESPAFDQTVSAFHYEYPINHFISQLKYSAQLQYLDLLADYLLAAITKSYQHQDLPERLVPVPLHKSKIAQRGFNQSRLLAQRLTKPLSTPVIKNGIYRIKKTLAQSGLDSSQRKNNIKGAFKINTHIPKHVAIIDDVVTTAMTVTELTQQLKLAGAQKIDIWCLARAYEL